MLDRDSRCHQLQVVRADTADHVLEGDVKCEAQVDLTHDSSELDRDRRRRLADHHFDRLQERRTRSKGIGDEGDGVGELLVERVQATGPAAAQPHPGKEEADDGADRQCESCSERGKDDAEHQEDERHRQNGPGPDGHELARLELEVRSRDVAGEVGAEVPRFDNTVQTSQGDAPADYVAETG